MNKNLIVFGTAALVAAGASFAQDEISVTTTFAWESSYVFRGVQLADETFMPAVDFAYGGAYFGIWSAQPADDEANEVDLYLGYGFDVGDGISADVGVTYYMYPDSSEDVFDSDVNTFEVYAGLSFDAVGSPSIYLYRDLDLDAWTMELSGGQSFDISDNDKLSFGLNGAIGYVLPDEDGEYLYVQASASIDYAFNDYASGSIYLSYAVTSEEYEYMGDLEDDEIWFGFSISGGF